MPSFWKLLIGLALLGPLPASAGERPYYADYPFGTTANVIDIGYGVLATPMSVIGEVLRRDHILQQAGREIGVEFRFHAFEKGVDTLPPSWSRSSMPACPPM
jgi:hypothetical protein